jgi:hypothetical protein
MPLSVYAIVDRRLNRRVLSIRANGAGVRFVKAGTAAAVVAECTGPLVPTERALRGHDLVVRRIARVAPAVLPMRFGTLVESARSLVALLDSWSDEVQQALALVDGRYQMTLRLFALVDASAPVKQNGPGGAVVDADDVTGATAHPGTSYLTRRARAEAVAQSAPELESLRAALAAIVAAERIARHDHGPLILTAYHLIPRGAAAKYRRLLRRHTAALPSRVVMSGPWAPYAFVPQLRR